MLFLYSLLRNNLNIFLSVFSLRCHKCHTKDIKVCIAYTPQECVKNDNGCYFEYEGKLKKMGCGRDWYRPAGCHGTKCIKWCHSDLCNKELIKDSPFRGELGEEDNSEEDSVGNWLSSLFGASVMIKVPSGVFFLMLFFNLIVFL